MPFLGGSRTCGCDVGVVVVGVVENSTALEHWAYRFMNRGGDDILAEGAMTLPVTLSGGVLFAS